MAISLEVRTGTAEDVYVLGAGQHACKVAMVSLSQQKGFQTEELVTKVRFEFQTLKALPENHPDEEKAGKFGVISAWVTLTKYQVTDKPNSGLTKLINSLFGRPLTEAEARKLDLEKLAGIKGHVLVTMGDNGKPKFVGFILPDGRPAPDPKDFQIEAGAVQTQPTPPKSAQAGAGGPKPKDAEVEDELADPFGEDAPPMRRPAQGASHGQGAPRRPEPVEDELDGIEDPFA